MAMLLDPRIRNCKFSDGIDINCMKSEYLLWLTNAVDGVGGELLQKACLALTVAAQNKKSIYMAGNGGSAVIAEHCCADLTKGTYFNGQPPIRAMALSCNTSLSTAIANDFGYENVFMKQLEYYAEEGDVFIAISSSGNSPNVCDAAEFAKKRNLVSIGFTGFSGGRLRDIVDISLHVPFSNYGVVEDSHQILLHVLSQAIIHERGKMEAGN